MSFSGWWLEFKLGNGRPIKELIIKVQVREIMRVSKKW